MQELIKADIILIGAGIMSATLGVLLKELEPSLSITIFEKLDAVSLESSDAWNNAGTGHSAFCELNYTPEKEDSTIDISKAIKIAIAFEQSKEFWSYLIENKKIDQPESFIQRIPHMSFVWGEAPVDFLKRRHAILVDHILFADLRYSDQDAQLNQWMPLVMQGRAHNGIMAATRMDIGTDVNFGNITRSLFKYLSGQPNVKLYTQHDVEDLYKNDDNKWTIKVKNEATAEKLWAESSFVFIGAGGGTLSLLEKTKLPEADGYGGFPISGQWLICNNDILIHKHWAKVYGKAAIGAPPMSVPHLDTRFINGQRALLFGPFAGFSTKFLKYGSYWDLPGSIELDNIIPMMSAGIKNIALTKYLVHQLSLNHEDKMNYLRDYLPLARSEEWRLGIAGQRVQVIKKDDKEGGVLEFGTELVCSQDGSLAALLGASPGASTAVSIMIDLLTKGFGSGILSNTWPEKIRAFSPAFDADFGHNKTKVDESRKRTSRVLIL